MIARLLVVVTIIVAACDTDCPAPPIVVKPVVVTPTAPRPACVRLDEHFLAAKVRSNYHSSCAISTTGDVACWGPLRAPCSAPPESVPNQLTELAHVRDLALSLDELCATDGVSPTTCFDFATGKRSQPFGAADELAASEHIMCARLTDGTVSCERAGVTWPVAQIAAARSIACKGDTCCAVVGDGSVKCWGRPALHTDYNGDDDRKASAIDVRVPPADTIRFGSDFTCVRTQAGGSFCWGHPNPGTLNRPTGVRALFSAGSTQCILGDDDTPSCYPWSALDHIVDMSGSCAAHVDGHVSCWGRNLEGELGDGMPMSYDAPVRVPGVDGAFDVYMDHSEACATDGWTMTCWGWWGRAVLPKLDGKLIDKPGFLLCARRDEGDVWCTGVMNNAWVVAPWRALLDPMDIVGDARPDQPPAYGASNGTTRCTVDRAQVWCSGDDSRGLVGQGRVGEAAIPVRVTRIGP